MQQSRSKLFMRSIQFCRKHELMGRFVVPALAHAAATFAGKKLHQFKLESYATYSNDNDAVSTLYITAIVM